MTTRTKMLSIVALMAALANILSIPPIAVPIAPRLTVHFTQLPIFVAGILAGPFGGLIAGAVGAVYMSLFVARIPFIIGGLAILGLATGIFSKRFRPFLAGMLAWLVQAPYVAVTDYLWFTISVQMAPQGAWALVASIMVTLTVEAVVSSALAEVIVRYLRRIKIVEQISSR